MCEGAVSDQVKVKKTAKTAPKVLETELGIKYIELKKGSGAFPTPNDYVIINYRCVRILLEIYDRPAKAKII